MNDMNSQHNELNWLLEDLVGWEIGARHAVVYFAD